jgi:outer membrane protein
MRYLYIIILLLAILPAQAQQQSFSLADLVDLARENSLAASQFSTQLERQQWSFKSYRASYLPQLALEGDIPSFTRSYMGVEQNDGSVSFKTVSRQYAEGRLNLSQALPFTGGEIFLSSALTRLDDFQRDSSFYNSRPLIIGLNQPILSFNAMKWERRIEPLKYNEAQKVYVEQMEAIGTQVCRLFFNALIAQTNKQVAEANLQNQQKLLEIAKTRHELGKISRSDLIQLELALVNSQKRLSGASLAISEAMRQIKAYTGYRGEDFSLRLPENVPDMIVDQQLALEKAQSNRKEESRFQRRLLEASREVARAKGQNGLTASLEATFGYNDQAVEFNEAYVQPIDQQTVKFSFHLPIADWGKAKAQHKTAEADKRLTEQSVAQERLDFEQQVIMQVEQFETLSRQVNFSEKADKLAAERYKIALERFALGDMSITEMMIAQNEKEQARLDYLQALQDFWQAWFMLRQLTLYDFEKQQNIKY